MRSPSSAEATMIERLPNAAGVPRDAPFEGIFRTHKGRVYGLCLHLCGNRALAEDALQETFLEVYKGLPGFRGDSQLGTWIYRVAMRTALRLRARNPSPVEVDVETALGATEPHAALVARENARVVQTALDALPAEQRVVVALFAAEGLGHAEIAEILGVPEGTVWSRLHKARKSLAAALKR
jgi:RNA polymerase sigma-70 factor (ECF subfamily)